MPRNLAISAVGAGGTIKDAIGTAARVITDEDISVFDAGDDFMSHRKADVRNLQRASNESKRNILNNLSEGQSPEAMEYALSEEDGSGNRVYADYTDDKTLAFNDANTDQGYINLAIGDASVDSYDLIERDAHETAHDITSNEAIAHSVGKSAADGWDVANWLYGDSVNTDGGITSADWNNTYTPSNNLTLFGNNIAASRIADKDREYYLLPKEKQTLVTELNNAKTEEQKEQIMAKYKAISDPRDKEFQESYSDCKKAGSCKDLFAIHYDLRIKLTEQGNEYFMASAENRKEFVLLPEDASIFHSYKRDPNTNEVIEVITGSQTGYKKYVHPIMGYEVVLDDKKKIVRDPLNMGTYNFYNPHMGMNNILLEDRKGILSKYFGLHARYDVKPYFNYGNAKYPIDPLTEKQRKLRSMNKILGSTSE